MENQGKNLVFIGMPSSGKTTIGKMISARLDMDFLDTDQVIREQEKRELRDIVNEDGLQGFLRIQENAILGLSPVNKIIATGGSVIYSPAVMEHLKRNAVTVYLKLGVQDLKSRLGEGRRFARNTSQTYEDLYAERTPLYEKYADRIIDCTSMSPAEIVEKIMKDFVGCI